MREMAMECDSTTKSDDLEEGEINEDDELPVQQNDFSPSGRHKCSVKNFSNSDSTPNSCSPSKSKYTHKQHVCKYHKLTHSAKHKKHTHLAGNQKFDVDSKLNHKMLSKNTNSPKKSIRKEKHLTKTKKRLKESIRNKKQQYLSRGNHVEISKKHSAAKKHYETLPNGRKLCIESVEKKIKKTFKNKRTSRPVDANSSYEDLLYEYKYIQSELKSLKVKNRQSLSCSKLNTSKISLRLIDNIKKETAAVNKSEKSEQSKTDTSAKNALNCKNTDVTETENKHNSEIDVQLSNDDDEDEEELRKIALASCAKSSSAKVTVQSGAQMSYTSQNECFPLNNNTTELNGVLSSSSNENYICSIVWGSGAAYSVSQNYDNYDVVDMELGSENEEENSEVSSPSPGTKMFEVDDDDEDFDVELLRAELISSLRRKRETDTDTASVGSDSAPPSSVKSDVIQHALITDSIKNSPSKMDFADTFFHTSNAMAIESVKLDTNSNSADATSEQVLQVVVNHVSNDQTKVIDLKENFKRSDVLPTFYMQQQPIVINLNDSSDSSDENEENGGTTIASLERLIETAKQQIPLSKSYDEKIEVPVAVSCLSEAQQEEYNKLRRLIAEKESKETENSKLVETAELKNVQEKTEQQEELSRLQEVLSHTEIEKNSQAQPQQQLQDSFQLLQKKLSLAKSTLQKKKEMIGVLKIKANKKMSAYISSQVTVQRLKEQLIAAEKVKNSNKHMMFEANAELQFAQKSVAKSIALINELNREFMKLGIQIYGPNFKPITSPEYLLPKFKRNSQV